MKEPYRQLAAELHAMIPKERVISDPLRTLAYGSDASFYRLIPQLVVRVESEEEVSFVVRTCHEHGLSVTFRAAGTSLSGQAVTDSVLVQLGNGWTDHEVLEDGAAIRLKPGVIGARANQVLAPFDRKIGPDPASINSCMVGGIAANNASGMCCGTAQNSYQTVRHMRVIMADGTVLDTSDADSRARFARSHARVLARLSDLSSNTRGNPDLAELIRHKYRLKNTTGYSLNALVDFTEPMDILKHLMIGSEGTLGFISEITYNTVPEYRHKAAALLYFKDIRDACEATMALKSEPVSAVELLDRAALRAVESQPGMPDVLSTLPDGACALLVDVRGETPDALAHRIEHVRDALPPETLLYPADFTQDPVTYELYWKVRKGTFPAVGAERVIGTTVIIEDVAFPMERLADGVLALQALLKKYRYDEAILFGHALEGNLHFVFTQGFDDPEEVARYEAFMDDVARLVSVDFGGSLKAEHGTGRNMAPYVEMEWGSEAYALMKTLKALFDPTNLLNPDVILSDNARLHVENLKPLPAAHETVDKCIECGFCEAVCPSRRLTLTPRQRIVLWREIKRLENRGDEPERLAELETAYQYQGIDTCAADGLCATECPVNINTGDLVRAIRSEQNQRFASRGQWVALHFAGVSAGARAGLTLAGLGRRLIGDGNMARAARVANTIAGGKLGHWTPAMPQAAPRTDRLIARLKPLPDEAPKVVYFPSCATRTMGAAPGDPDQRSVQAVTLAVLEKAGFQVIIPEALDTQCCGMAFQSKGLFQAGDQKRTSLLDALRVASEDGRWPVLCDTSPCTLRLKEGEASDLILMEPAEFVYRHALPRLSITPQQEPVALHVTCSSTRMGQTETLVALAEACATTVIRPPSVTCCGFAGDKGFSHPELNASALQDLKQEVVGCARGYSNSRTCEIGLSEHAGIAYQSILYLVDAVSQPAKPLRLVSGTDRELVSAEGGEAEIRQHSQEQDSRKTLKERQAQ